MLSLTKGDLGLNQLEDRVSVVTGAGSGIGRATAERLATSGSTVILTDLAEDAVEMVRERLDADGFDVAAFQVDVRDIDALAQTADLIVERFGGLHICVNNAGIVNRGFVWELTDEEWRRVLEVNLWGVINSVRAFVPKILASGSEGHVVNVASMAAVHPQERLGPYTVAKHGVLGLSDVLRADLAAVGADVGVSVVMPGKIRTAMNPIGTVEPETVAANIVDAIQRNRPYVFSDNHSVDEVQARFETILASRREVLSR